MSGRGGEAEEMGFLGHWIMHDNVPVVLADQGPGIQAAVMVNFTRQFDWAVGA